MASTAVLVAAAVLTATLALGGPADEATSTTALPQLGEPGAARRRPLDPIAAYSTTVARPLFSPKRRPEAPPAAPVAVMPPPPPAPVAPPPPGTLLGILISPRGRAAIIKLASGRSETVAEGGSVEGWLIKQVLPDRVLLQSGATSVEVTFPAPQPQSATVRPAGQAVLPLRRRG